jgi:isocitrate lyase
LVWCETSKPCLKDAKKFADAVRGAHPDQMLAYNCSPSFNWKQHIPSETELAEFQKELGKMGFKFQFITLAGFHSTNFAVFDFAREYKREGMLAYSNLQEKEFDYQQYGFTTVKHQAEVGVGYFDAISQAVGADSVAALADSTESEQFG